MLLSQLSNEASGCRIPYLVLQNPTKESMMRGRKAYVALCAIVACAAMTVSGCGGSNEAGGKTKIRFATWDQAEDVDRQQSLVDKFNSSQDKIEVNLEAYGNDFDTKISAGMGSNDAPDVMYMWNYPSYAKGLEPLDTYIQKQDTNYKKGFYPTLWNYNSYQGKTYGIPVGFTTHALYYNKDLFKKAGLKEPTNDWTWKQLQDAARIISSKTDAKGLAFQMKPDPYDFEMYLWSNGAAYSDDKGNMKGNVDSAKALQSYQMFQDMEKSGDAVATEGNGTDEFRSGTVAMFVYGSWALNTLDKEGIHYGVVNIPRFEDQAKSVSILSSSGVSMSKTTKHKAEAWKFIQFWTNAESNKARIGSELPVLTKVVDSEKIEKKPEYKPFYAMLKQSDGFTPSNFRVPDWSEKSDKLSLAFEKMYNPSTYEKPVSALASVTK